KQQADQTTHKQTLACACAAKRPKGKRKRKDDQYPDSKRCNNIAPQGKLVIARIDVIGMQIVNIFPQTVGRKLGWLSHGNTQYIGFERDRHDEFRLLFRYGLSMTQVRDG